MNKNRKPKPLRVPVPLTDIETNLSDQIGFLEKSNREFDAGDRSEFRRIALAIRILVHDNPPSSTSLLSQVGLANIDFVSTATAINPENMLNEFSLAMITMGGSDFSLSPLCAVPIPLATRMMPLADWLSENVLRDWEKNLFTRWDFIRVVANQAGGAHVDANIEEAYFKLTQSSGFGWSGTSNGQTIDLVDIEKVYIRQMAWELLESVRPAWKRVLGNRPCQCQSGRKARYCCNKI